MLHTKVYCQFEASYQGLIAASVKAKLQCIVDLSTVWHLEHKPSSTPSLSGQTIHIENPLKLITLWVDFIFLGERCDKIHRTYAFLAFQGL